MPFHARTALLSAHYFAQIKLAVLHRVFKAYRGGAEAEHRGYSAGVQLFDSFADAPGNCHARNSVLLGQGRHARRSLAELRLGIYLPFGGDDEIRPRSSGPPAPPPERQGRFLCAVSPPRTPSAPRPARPPRPRPDITHINAEFLLNDLRQICQPVLKILDLLRRCPFLRRPYTLPRRSPRAADYPHRTLHQRSHLWPRASALPYQYQRSGACCLRSAGFPWRRSQEGARPAPPPRRFRRRWWRCRRCRW